MSGNKPPTLGAATAEALQSDQLSGGQLSGGTWNTGKDYHSVAGQTAAALQALKPLMLLDFIDSRVREIDAERNRLSMLREQLTSAGLSVSVDDIRRVLG